MKKHLLAGLALVSGMAVLMSTSPSSAAPLCASIFAELNRAEKSGVLVAEQYTLFKERHAVATATFNEGMASLKKGGADWKPLDPELVKVVDEAMKIVKPNGFDVINPARTKAIQDVESALSRSSEFGSLSARSIKEVTEVVLSLGPKLEIPIFNAEQILNSMRLSIGLETSSALKTMVLAVEKAGVRQADIAQKIYDLEYLNRPELKTLENKEQLVILWATNKETILNLVGPSPTVLAKWLEIAREHQAANLQFDILTPAHHAARKKFDQFMADEPYFKDLDQSNKQLLHYRFYRVKTSEDIVAMMIPMKPQTAELKNALKLEIALEKIVNVMNLDYLKFPGL